MHIQTPILITGSAGFIGFHLSRRLLQENIDVVGLDNLNDYYDVHLKEARLEELQKFETYSHRFIDLHDRSAMKALFENQSFEIVVNLAAQAGVRYSLANPHAYVDSNLTGFANLLEGCRHNGVGHLVFASSSSVYGANTAMPFSVHQNVDHPLSLYAATKKANELMAHTYAHLYGLPCTGLRFFTVYGPWGRPDMALFLFTKAILEGKPIQIFNNGRMRRDFTYIDDIIEAMVRIMKHPARGDEHWNGMSPDPGTSRAPYRIYNIGSHHPVALMEFIHTLEECLGRKAEKEFLPLQPGDVLDTYADVSDLEGDFGSIQKTALREGISRFVEWYRAYFGV